MTYYVVCREISKGSFLALSTIMAPPHPMGQRIKAEFFPVDMYAYSIYTLRDWENNHTVALGTNFAHGESELS